MNSARRLKGRPSLNGGGESPQLRLRVPAELLEALSGRAAEEGTTISDLTRQVLMDAVYSRPTSGGLGARGPMGGPLGHRLRERRKQVLAVARAHGLTNLRVFGSVARGTERSDSDIDLLVDVPPGMGLIGLGRARAELEHTLDARVDLIPSTDLKSDIASSAAAELVAL